MAAAKPTVVQRSAVVFEAAIALWRVLDADPLAPGADPLPAALIDLDNAVTAYLLAIAEQALTS